MARAPQIRWPDGKRFAFTAFDDTDATTETNGPPVYEFLRDLGILITKSVWPIRSKGEVIVGGETCENESYARWVQRLQSEGFEIGLHNASCGTSTREETALAFARFAELFGHDPRSLSNHVVNSESIYWADARVSGWRRAVYLALTRAKTRCYGHVEGHALFWGDLCRERVRYVRNFVFDDINCLNPCPMMPYHDPERPYVNQWFASSEGGTLANFKRLLSEENQDRLESEGGCCVMYTHFGYGFYRDGKLDPEFRRLMERLASKQGWFAPVSDVLDHIQKERGPRNITAGERAALERRWLRHKVLNTRGTS